MGIASVSMELKNEWLAELLKHNRDRITEYWIGFIRIEANCPHYANISDEQLRKELPPTVECMIYALETGDVEGPRKHSIFVISRRLAQGFFLPELQMSLHALQSAVIRIVMEAQLGAEKQCEAYNTSGNMFYRVAVIAAEVYQQVLNKQQAHFAASYELGTALSSTLDLDTVLDIATRKVREFLDATSVVIILIKKDGRRAEARAFTGIEGKLAKMFPTICSALGCACLDLEISEAREQIQQISDICASKILSKWRDRLAAQGCFSLICVPLVFMRKRIGSLMVCKGQAYEFSNSDIDLLLALADHIATAVQNARLYDEAKGKREMSLLLDASKIFTSTLRRDEVLHQVARLTVLNTGADFSQVFLPDDAGERLHVVTQYARDSKSRDLLGQICEVIEPEGIPVGEGAGGLAFRRGEPILIEDYSKYEGRIEKIVGLRGQKSVLSVPIKFRGRPIGAFMLGALRTNAFSNEDMSLAAGVAGQAAIALENARLYERERNISETLQRSFLPMTLPDIEGYDLAAFYRPAFAEAEIGGDFYDVFEVGPDRIAIIVADVSGKGLNAAIQTAMGKYTMRAFVCEDPSPGSVLERTNAVFCEHVPQGTFVTAIYAVLDAKTGTLTYANAGHSLPMLYTKETDSVESLDVTGPALGIIPGSTYGEKRITIESECEILLYTDGATDVWRDREMLDPEGLELFFRKNALAPAEKVVQGIFRDIQKFSDGSLPDDVVLFVLKRIREDSRP